MCFYPSHPPSSEIKMKFAEERPFLFVPQTFMMRKYVYCAQHNKNHLYLTVNVISFNTYKLYKYSKSIKTGVRLIYGFLRSFRYRKKIEITKLHLTIKIFITLYFQWHWDDICQWRIKTPKRPPTVTRSVVRWVAARADHIRIHLRRMSSW